MQLRAEEFQSTSVQTTVTGNTAIQSAGKAGKGFRAAFALVLLALLVSACATLDRGECEAGQWRQIGYHDGARGYGDEFLGLHQKACAKHGVAVAESGYNNGYLAGLADFCQPQTAYRLGRNEEIYNYVCPAEFELPFVVAYVDGLTETMRDLQLHESFLEDRLWYATVRYQSLQTSHVDTSSDTPTQVLTETRVLSALRDGVDNHRDRRARIRNALARANRFLQANPAATSEATMIPVPGTTTQTTTKTTVEPTTEPATELKSGN